MPIEPPPTRWEMPDLLAVPDGEDFVGVGADLAPGTLLAGYRSGVFAMPIDPRRKKSALGWWSPDPRGVIPLDGVHVSGSLRKSLRRLDVTFDAAFDEVLTACADPTRSGRWLNDAMHAAYLELNQLGWAHSVEVWTRAGDLAGGLFGVEIGGLFAGESMFHRARDASKVAVVALVEQLRTARAARAGARLLDVQWCTPHLRSLGAVEVSRTEYLSRLATALPSKPAF
jgi:leucyl/phenylalanyl-tRNA--protein transferase